MLDLSRTMLVSGIVPNGAYYGNSLDLLSGLPVIRALLLDCLVTMVGYSVIRTPTLLDIVRKAASDPGLISRTVFPRKRSLLVLM